MVGEDPTAHSEIVSHNAISPEATGKGFPFTADDVVLRLGPDDRLAVAWGGIVSQKAGQPRDTEFGHDPSYWLVFVNAGTLRIALDGRPIEISQGHTLLVRPHETCRGTGHDESAAQWQWLAFRVRRSRRGSRQVCVEAPRVSRVHDPERMAELFRLVAEEFHQYRISRQSEDAFLDAPGAHYMMMSLLTRLDPAHLAKQPTTRVANVLAERARDYIRTNFTRAISTSDIASELDCSRGYLGVAFRQAYGESPLSYMLGLRIAVAARFLRETRMSVGQVAREVGFTELNYFSRVFRSRYGMTPSAYRKANSRLYVTTDI